MGGGYFANKVSIPEEYCENFFVSFSIISVSIYDISGRSLSSQ